jgi:general stress protein 26
MTEAVADTRPGVSEESVAKQREEFFERLEKTPFCMLITHDESGAMHVRPMTTQCAAETGQIWMFVAADSETAAEVSANPNVLLTYADTGDNAFVAVRGHGAIVRDPGRAKELWTKMAEAWFPGGPEDPNLALLRITLSSAEHWEPPQGKVMQFVEIVTAALTHHKPEHVGVYLKLHL